MGCKNDFTSESQTFDPARDFTDYPTYLCPPNPLVDYGTIGTDVSLEMLLTQYQNSPNLKEYLAAFVLETDLLLEQIKKVHLGRYIQNATGRQLDVIGIILQQSRNIHIPTVWFGFQGASPIDGMADEASPANGGIFKDENIEGIELTPLADPKYRDVLLCRAFCINKAVFSINTIYEAISILLGQTPNHMILSEVQHKVWELQLDSNTITSEQVGLILSVSHWFIPMTVGFNISLVGGLFDVEHDGITVEHDLVTVTHTA